MSSSADPGTSAPARAGVRVAVDAIGGDYGAPEVVPGALAYARAHPEDEIILCGDDALMAPLLRDRPANVRTVHAPELIGMDEHPARALVRKKRSSIVVATELVKGGEADAIVTAGHTGAGMAAGVLILGTLPGIDRPALAVQVPGGDPPLVLLDIGANPDSTAEHLAQYARMGAIYSERVVGVKSPRVALLSLGEERGKGDARVKQATGLIDLTDLNFVGNVEGKDLTADLADVVVCDAMVGNVVIKFFEGLSGFIFDQLRTEFRRGWRGKLAYLLLRPGVARIRDTFDYEVVGGSPLLGVKGEVIITHGRARRRMIEHAVRVGATMARERVAERIAEALAADVARTVATVAPADAAEPAAPTEAPTEPTEA